MNANHIIYLDFDIISSENNKHLFAGKKNGIEYANKYNLSAFADKPIINFIVPEHCVISGSFYLGLLSPFFQKFTKPEDCYEHIIFNGKYYEKGMVSEFERAINSAFGLKNIYA